MRGAIVFSVLAIAAFVSPVLAQTRLDFDNVGNNVVSYTENGYKITINPTKTNDGFTLNTDRYNPWNNPLLNSSSNLNFSLGFDAIASFTLAAIDGSGFSVDAIKYTTRRLDPQLPSGGTPLRITGFYGPWGDVISAGVTVTSAVFTFQTSGRSELRIDSITLGPATNNVLATPGPLAGAGLPALVGLIASMLAGSRRRGADPA